MDRPGLYHSPVNRARTEQLPALKMNDILPISSVSNPRVKDVIKLRKRSHRDSSGMILVEGYREVKRALENGVNPKELFMCRDFFRGGNETELVEQCRKRGALVLECSERVFTKVAYRDRPEGLLAVAKRDEQRLSDFDPPSDCLFIVAQGIEKPGNLGTIIRSADSAGANGMIVCDKCTDIRNPNVVRESIGTLFALTVAEASSSEAIDWLKKHSVRIIAATPHAETLHTDCDFTGNTAIVLGAEQYGLTDIWIEQADSLARIPMLGQSDSLNVASAATILLYEAVRQRNADGH